MILQGEVCHEKCIEKGYCQRDKAIVGQISLYFSDSSSWLWIFSLDKATPRFCKK